MAPVLYDSDYVKKIYGPHPLYYFALLENQVSPS